MLNANDVKDVQADQNVLHLKIPASPSSLKTLTEEDLKVASGVENYTKTTECAGIC